MTVISGMSRLIITELETLAYLNPYVMHPFLHCLEQSTQSEPLINFPKLYKDLLVHKTHPLQPCFEYTRYQPLKFNKKSWETNYLTNV